MSGFFQQKKKAALSQTAFLLINACGLHDLSFPF